jgi:hypothetical protein
MGMPTVLTVNGTGTSGIWFPDWMQNPFNIGIQCIATGGAATQYQVEHTLDNIEIVNALSVGGGFVNTVVGTATFIANPGITAATASNINGNYAFPVRGIRINVQSATATTVVTVTFVQATFGR